METLDEFLARGGQIKTVAPSSHMDMTENCRLRTSKVYDSERVLNVLAERGSIDYLSLHNNLGWHSSALWVALSLLVAEGRITKKRRRNRIIISLVDQKTQQ